MTRDELYALIPWYETGRLSAEEHEAVHALLAGDLEGNRQRRELSALRSALEGEPLLAANMSAGLERFRAQFEPAAPARARPAPVWIALAATLAIALGIGGFLAGERAGRYRTLSDATPMSTLPLAPDVELLRVSVVEGVAGAELVRIGADPELRIVDGPSAYGVATLAAPRARSAAIQARLRADPRLRFVGPATH